MAQIPGIGGGTEPDIGTEHRLTALETRLDVILPTLATKADIAEVKTAIAESKSSLLIWGITTAVAVVAILVSLMLFLAQQLEATPSNSNESGLQSMVSQLPTISAPTSTSAPTTVPKPKQYIVPTERPQSGLLRMAVVGHDRTFRVDG